MRYVVKEIDDRSKTGITQPDKFKKVTIYFSYRGNNEVYENQFTDIVLFLSELEDFIEDVHNSNFACWYWGFAPFAFGKFEDGVLKISSHSGNEFGENIYESMKKDDLNILKSQIKSDIRRYGRLAKREAI